jgi:hypothetical protein
MMVFYIFLIYIARKFLRYQRRNQKPLIEGQTTHIQEKKKTNNDLQNTTQK